MNGWTNVALAAIAAVTATASSLPQEAKDAKILRLLDVTGAVNVEQARGLFEAGLEQGAGTLSADVKDKLWREFVSSFPREDATQRLAAAYDDIFSEQEIEDLLAFYDTPVGRKVLQSQSDLLMRSALTMQDLGARTIQQVMSKLFYYVEGQAHRRAGQLDAAIESFRKAVGAYPEDADFREALGKTLAAAGRTDEARIELEALARLRPGAPIVVDALPFVGLWRFEGYSVWVEFFDDGRAFQCRVDPDNEVFKSEGILNDGHVVWKERWGTETVSKTAQGIAIGKNEFRISHSRMDDLCQPPSAESRIGPLDSASGTRAARPMFFEPTYKQTFGPQDVTPSNTAFHVKVIAKTDGEAIRLHRCAVPCDSATITKIWASDEYAQGDELLWTATREGKHYLWVQHGATAKPVAGAFEQVHDERARMVFESGTILEVWYVRP